MQHSASAPIDLLSRAFTATRDRTPHLTERMLLLQVQRDGSDEQYLPSVDQRRRQLTKFDPSFSPLTKPNRSPHRHSNKDRHPNNASQTKSMLPEKG